VYGKKFALRWHVFRIRAVRAGMNRFVGRWIAALAAAFAVTTAMHQTAAAQSTPQLSINDLLSRMVAQSSSLQTYTASVHADVAMHTFPFLSPSLDGMYYHKEPSMNKIVFTSGLPFMAKEFSKVYPEVESPSRWNEIYLISSEGDDSNFTTLKLIPRKHSRIDHIDAKIDDKTAEVVSLRWTYNDGGFATLDQTYSSIQGHLLVTQQTGHFEVPHYDADLKSTFSNFKINTPIPDSVFATSS
jgi:hypothetical protein